MNILQRAGGEQRESGERGFTLVELMIGLVMAGIVVAVIYSAYTIQTKIYTEQGKTAEMQQNIRAGLTYLQGEIRMAGYNPAHANAPSCGTCNGAPGIHTATAAAFGFSMDLNGNGDCGDPGENVTYSIYTASDGRSKLGRAAPNIRQAVAEDITHIEFLYMFDPPKAPKRDPVLNELHEIVAVQVSLLARARYPDQSAPAAESFTLPLPDAWGALDPDGGTVWGVFSDSFRRRLLTTTINIRNMGM